MGVKGVMRSRALLSFADALLMTMTLQTKTLSLSLTLSLALLTKCSFGSFLVAQLWGISISISLTMAIAYIFAYCLSIAEKKEREDVN